MQFVIDFVSPTSMDLNPKRVIGNCVDMFIGNCLDMFILQIMPQRVVTINLLLLLRFACDEQQKYIRLVNLIEGSAKPINIIIMLQQSRCYSGLPLMGSLTSICLQFNITQY